jgi:hypothetical protein
MLETLLVILADGRQKVRRIDKIAEQVNSRDRSKYTVTGISRKRIRAAFEAYVPGKWVVRAHPKTPDACKRGAAEGWYTVERVQHDTVTLEDAYTAFEKAVTRATQDLLALAQNLRRAAISQSGAYTKSEPSAVEAEAPSQLELDAFSDYDG